MRALVTGGAGFIGSALVERLLAGGDEVDVVDDLSRGSLGRLSGARRHGRAFGFHQIDIAQRELPALVARRRPEVIYHLAALAGPDAGADPARDVEVSLLGTLRLLEGARAAGTAKVVYTAGPEVCADPAPRGRASGHGLSERAVVDFLGLYRERHGLEFTALALAEVYGPGAPPGGIVAGLLDSLGAGRACAVPDGEWHDLVYLDDAVDAIVRAGVRGSGLVVPIGTGEATSTAVLAGLLAAGTGGRVETTGRAGGRARHRPLDPARAHLHLGWAPFTPLPEGIAAVLGATSPLRAAAGR